MPYCRLIPLPASVTRGLTPLSDNGQDRGDPRWMTYKQAEAAGYQVRRRRKRHVGSVLEVFAKKKPGYDEEGKPVLDAEGEPVKEADYP